MKTRINFKWHIPFFLLFFSLFPLDKAIGQFSLCDVSRHQLRSPELYHPDSVYIQVKQVDSLDHLAIFLINTTSDTLFFSQYSSKIFIKTEAINRDGEWACIDGFNQIDCGVGLGEIALLPDSFFWIRRGKFHGDYTTKVRFNIGNSSSTPLSVQIDSNYFNPEYSLILEWIDRSLSETDSVASKAKIFQIKSQYFLFRTKNYTEALKNVEKALQLNPELHEAKLTLGDIYVRLGIKCQKRDLALSAAFEIWNNIPKSATDTFIGFEKRKKQYFPFLPTKNELEKSNPDCYTKDGQTYCYLGCGINRYVKIYFRE